MDNKDIKNNSSVDTIEEVTEKMRDEVRKYMDNYFKDKSYILYKKDFTLNNF